MSVMKNDIGNRVYACRRAAELNQREFAERIGISEKYVSKIESGKHEIGSNVLMQICEEFHLSADYILFGTIDGTEKGHEDYVIYEKRQFQRIKLESELRKIYFLAMSMHADKNETSADGGLFQDKSVSKDRITNLIEVLSNLILINLEYAASHCKFIYSKHYHYWY